MLYCQPCSALATIVRCPGVRQGEGCTSKRYRQSRQHTVRGKGGHGARRCGVSSNTVLLSLDWTMSGLRDVGNAQSGIPRIYPWRGSNGDNGTVRLRHIGRVGKSIPQILGCRAQEYMKSPYHVPGSGISIRCRCNWQGKRGTAWRV
jgi:hypothetical protein